MDTPYRMTKLLTEVKSVFGQHQEVLLACDMTLKTEVIFHGNVGEILSKVSGQKREFILILNLNKRKS
jgi:16S rRNA C1402 (ribose-2'-O) methylase RsmI